MTRARDRLGRPLADDADPTLIYPPVPERDDLTDEQAWALGMAYLDEDLPFHVHEVFEMRWRTAPDVDRLAWQALAQWGAALTHSARGNPAGADRLADRCLANLDRADHVPEAIDLDLVNSSCQSLLR
jgi:hypothetical protein